MNVTLTHRHATPIAVFFIRIVCFSVKKQSLDKNSASSNGSVLNAHTFIKLAIFLPGVSFCTFLPINQIHREKKTRTRKSDDKNSFSHLCFIY